MKMKKNKLFLLVAIFLLPLSEVLAQTVTGEPAGIPEKPKKWSYGPWEDPQVTSINREAARAT